ncbi:MAG: hypothetical protein WC852_06190 [Candidatus Nanoarchaeia archaeon]|jgi:hypothetical protein
MIKLGGSIMLDGFDSMEPAKLVVAKKLIGLCAKKTTESMGNLDFFNVLLEGKNVKVSVKAGEKSSEAFAEAENFFMALSRALSEIETKAKA